MSCINIDSIIFLNSYDLSNPVIEQIESSVSATQKHIENEYDFYFLQLSNDRCLDVFDLDKVLTNKIVKDLQDKKYYLVIDNSLEYFVSLIEKIYTNIIDAYNIPLEQVIFLSSIPNIEYYVNNTAKKLGKSPIKCEWFSLFEVVGKEALEQLGDYVNLPKRIKFYDKKFLNLNRRWRLHRPLLVTLLRDRGLLNEGFISMARADDGLNWHTVIPKLQRMYSHHTEISKVLQRNNDISSLPDMYLDTSDLVTNRAIHENTVNNFYEQTYFSVITETTYHEDIPFLSEKVFKAIAMGHPFILVSAPNTLQYLRELGYKTFHPMIDEKYDTITNHGDRMLYIVNEIERLCNMDRSELKKWLKSARFIAKHNMRILNSRTNFTIKKNY